MGKLFGEQRERFGRILAISILLHVLLAALFFLKMPYRMPTPEENPVQVELVPPPPEEKPPEAKPPEPPPPPKQEEAKKPDPPKPEPKPPEPEKQQPIPVLKPAVQFGEKDSGPKQSIDGAAAEEQAKADEDKPADPPEGTAQAEPAKPEPPPPAPQPKPAEPPQTLAANNPADTKVQLNDRAQDAPPPADKPVQDAKPEDKAGTATGKPGTGRKLTQARKIFSRKQSADPFARLAMGMVSRDVRFDRLCGTELVAQLQNGSPAYNPVLFPRVVRPTGNVFNLENGSFRDAEGWHELSFKCEVDSEAMKVVSFAYSVGKPIPKSEWRSRHLPDY